MCIHMFAGNCFGHLVWCLVFSLVVCLVLVLVVFFVRGLVLSFVFVYIWFWFVCHAFLSVCCSAGSSVLLLLLCIFLCGWVVLGVCVVSCCACKGSWSWNSKFRELSCTVFFNYLFMFVVVSVCAFSFCMGHVFFCFCVHMCGCINMFL